MDNLNEIIKVRKFFINDTDEKPYVIKEAGGEYKVYPFVLATEALDRQFEKVKLTSKSITNFKKNPQMYLNHDSRQLPVGEWRNIRIEDGKLKADAFFHGIDEQSQRVQQYVELGQLKAASIGFQSLKRSAEAPDAKQLAELASNNTWRGKILIHEEIDILEASVVGIPANAEALMGKSYGLETEVIKGLDDLFNPKTTVNYEYKAGAVLNKANKSKLENAKSLIDEVLTTAKAEEAEAEPEAEPDKSYEPLIESMQAEIKELREALNAMSETIKSMNGQPAKKTVIRLADYQNQKKINN